jgi:hypothetical protein
MLHRIQIALNEWAVFDERWPNIVEIIPELTEDEVIQESDNIYEHIANKLRSVQQGASDKLLIHGRKVYAHVMDQTAGQLEPDDILSYEDANGLRCFSRLSSIISGKFEP